jgi:RNA polymerase sigma-70 factor (ECF subfamily)
MEGVGVSTESSALNDADLIVASRDDSRAFRRLYDLRAAELLAYFYRRVLDAEVAADLLAETFAVAYAKRHRFRAAGSPGEAWLYGIARKELAHWYRHQQVERRALRRLSVQVPLLDQESIAQIEATVDVDGYREALTSALEQISELERDAVRLRVVSDLSYRQIAERLGCSEAAARTRVCRGLARLGELMEATG